MRIYLIRILSLALPPIGYLKERQTYQAILGRNGGRRRDSNAPRAVPRRKKCGCRHK